MALAGTARVVVVARCARAPPASLPSRRPRPIASATRALEADRAWTQIQRDGQRLERVVERSNGARLRLAQAQERDPPATRSCWPRTRVNLTHAEQALSASLISAYKSPVPDPLQAALEAHSFGEVLEQFALLDRTNTYNAGMLKSIRVFRVRDRAARARASSASATGGAQSPPSCSPCRPASTHRSQPRSSATRGLRAEVRRLIEARRQRRGGSLASARWRGRAPCASTRRPSWSTTSAA